MSELSAVDYISLLLNEDNIVSPVVFDIGAYHGKFSIDLLERFPDASIYAYEPNEQHARILDTNLQSCDRSWISVRALSNSGGTCMLYICNHAQSSALSEFTPSSRDFSMTTSVAVSLSTLDVEVRKLNVQHIDVLKIDTNGHEKQVLDGASRLLARESIGIICCELVYYPYYQSQCRPEDIQSIMSVYGLSCLALYPVYHRGRLRYADAIFAKRSAEWNLM